MKAYKCDVCGEFYLDPCPTDRYGIHHANAHGTIEKVFDLCPHCVLKLEAFVRGDEEALGWMVSEHNGIDLKNVIIYHFPEKKFREILTKLFANQKSRRDGISLNSIICDATRINVEMDVFHPESTLGKILTDAVSESISHD